MNNAGLKNIFSFYRRKSTLIVLFIIFVVFYAIFDFIIRKTDVHNKLFNKSIVKNISMLNSFSFYYSYRLYFQLNMENNY